MKLNKIHHIAIICSNYEKAKEFYVDILGLEIVRETYRNESRSFKLDLSVGGAYQIELFSFPDAPKRLNYPEAKGLRHLAFEVDNIEEAVQTLAIQHISTEPIRIDEITQKKFVFFKDPDDLPIELYQK